MSKVRVFFAAPLPRTKAQEDLYATDNLIKDIGTVLRILGWKDRVELISPKHSIDKFDTATASDEFYAAQGQRERLLLMSADVIVFCFDRDIRAQMLGLTTNIEFGLFHNHPFAVFGCCRDDISEKHQKVKYVKNFLAERGTPFCVGLNRLVSATIGTIQRAMNALDFALSASPWLSQDPRRSMIPAACFAVDSTLPWLTRFVPQLTAFEVVAWLRNDPATLFGFTAKVTAGKKSEFVHFRPNMADVRITFEDHEVFVREMRFPAAVEVNYRAGGSSTQTAWDDPQTAQKEVEEELGLVLALDRFVPDGPPSFLSPLTDAALVFHWHVALTREEFAQLKEGASRGNANEGELCKTTITKIKETKK